MWQYLWFEQMQHPSWSSWGWQVRTYWPIRGRFSHDYCYHRRGSYWFLLVRQQDMRKCWDSVSWLRTHQHLLLWAREIQNQCSDHCSSTSNRENWRKLPCMIRSDVFLPRSYKCMLYSKLMNNFINIFCKAKSIILSFFLFELFYNKMFILFLSEIIIIERF